MKWYETTPSYCWDSSPPKGDPPWTNLQKGRLRQWNIADLEIPSKWRCSWGNQWHELRIVYPVVFPEISIDFILTSDSSDQKKVGDETWWKHHEMGEHWSPCRNHIVPWTPSEFTSWCLIHAGNGWEWGLLRLSLIMISKDNGSLSH